MGALALHDDVDGSGPSVARSADEEVAGTLLHSGYHLHGSTINFLNVATLAAPPARFDLRNATITELRDAPNRWPQQLDLDGLTYRSLQPVLPPGQRLVWLNRDRGTYRPQPYEQLAAYYRRLGHEDDARTVLLARHRHRRATRRLPARLWERIEDLAVGYGYRPGRALAWLCGLTALTAVAFTVQPPRALRTDGPDLQPVAYALDLILPILDLGQERAFTPVGTTRWVAWAAVLAGWLLATTVIAGITRRATVPEPTDPKEADTRDTSPRRQPTIAKCQ